MNAIDAAAKVLADLGKPLSYRQITRDVLETGTNPKSLLQVAGRVSCVG